LSPHTFFVILHILDIPDKFGVKIFFLKKGLHLELFSIKFFARTFFKVFFHIDEYFYIQEQFSILKFLAIRDVLSGHRFFWRVLRFIGGSRSLVFFCGTISMEHSF